jgi:hypothetical protein
MTALPEHTLVVQRTAVDVDVVQAEATERLPMAQAAASSTDDGGNTTLILRVSWRL